MRRAARETRAGANKIMFVGNGGSAGISSHLGIDYSKSGGLRARALNDPADLTYRAVARLGGGRIVNRQRATPCRRRHLLRRIQRIRVCRGCALSLCHGVLDIEMGWRGRSHPIAAREAELLET
jgi:hypothetical protein